MSVSVLDFSGVAFDPKKYFIYSDLLEDSGIECPDLKIAKLCLLVDNLNKFVEVLDGLTLDEIIETYDFFDKYCVSQGILQLIKLIMQKRTAKNKFPPKCNKLICIKNGEQHEITFDDCLSKPGKIDYMEIDSENDYYRYHVVFMEQTNDEIIFALLRSTCWAIIKISDSNLVEIIINNEKYIIMSYGPN